MQSISERGTMNIFEEKQVAQEYDVYYEGDLGKQIDEIEKQAIESLVKSVVPGKMLEIGCGTGHWTRFFVEKGFQVTATDVSEPMLEQARKKDLPVDELMYASVFDLPFESNSFDQVAVITALEFCGDIPRGLEEMKRVLKPGGWLIAGCLNADSVPGQNRANDPVFKHGDFMTKELLTTRLTSFGKPQVQECVFLSPDFLLLDNTPEQSTVGGVFLAAAVQKEN